MLLSDFDYNLPEELIAQKPLAERDASRMLVVDRKSGTWQDRSFRDFTEYITPNDLIVVNNSRVIPARLLGRRKETGGKVEIFLVRELGPLTWEAMVRPSARLHLGSRVVFGNDELEAEMLDDTGAELRHVRFHCEGPFDEALSAVGSTPLPPYIKRPEGVSLADDERYQTVYSKPRGAIAAPTAGLHFTPQVLQDLRDQNQLVEITLHVGYGTFEPVKVEDVDDHRVSSERFEISPETAAKINATRANGGRIVAIGTTTTRALESASTQDGKVMSGPGIASLTITPGYKFRTVNMLLTNFHLPQSSLLILVSTFAGRELMLRAYEHAVAASYRFYSYGDCMLIV
jgi:S-adenosylmethionine:tRNA ribosyltransferase-isomerase